MNIGQKFKIENLKLKIGRYFAPLSMTNIILLLLSCIFISCTNENTPFGYPGSNTEYLQTILPDSLITDIYTYRDSVDTYAKTADFLMRTYHETARNNKLILGNYQGADIRTLIRFTTLPTDSSFIKDPTITLFVNKVVNSIDIKIRIAPIDSVVFYDNTATWEQWGRLPGNRWKTPGGDYSLEKSQTVAITASDSLSSIEFTIDSDLAKQWIAASNRREWDKIYGLLIMVENVSDSFIEIFSTNSLTRRPEIRFTYPDEEIVRRDATYSTFIHNKKNETADDIKTGLYIANIAPRSIFVELADLEKLFTVFISEQIRCQQDLPKINIIQASLILSIDSENKMWTNNNIYYNSAIPFDDYGDIKTTFPPKYNEMWHYSRYHESTDNDKISLNISTPIQFILSGNRPNNGICIVNNQRNMDFSHINFYGMDATEDLRPKIVIKYSVLRN